MEKATFGAGCFWSVEAAFRKLPGVVMTAVGYSGGCTMRPSYEDVCSDETGHAEVVEIEFDPAEISYEQLLDAFFTTHDPTQLNRQGPDVGSQYRSMILTHSAEQDVAARAAKLTLERSGRFRRPVVTEIATAGPFWRAEEYHQQYLEKRGVATCSIGVS